MSERAGPSCCWCYSTSGRCSLGQFPSRLVQAVLSVCPSGCVAFHPIGLLRMQSCFIIFRPCPMQLAGESATADGFVSLNFNLWCFTLINAGQHEKSSVARVRACVRAPGPSSTPCFCVSCKLWKGAPTSNWILMHNNRCNAATDTETAPFPASLASPGPC